MICGSRHRLHQQLDKGRIQTWRTFSLSWRKTRTVHITLHTMTIAGHATLRRYRSARVMSTLFNGRLHAIGLSDVHRLLSSHVSREPLKLSSVLTTRAEYCNNNVCNVCGVMCLIRFVSVDVIWVESPWELEVTVTRLTRLYANDVSVIRKAVYSTLRYILLIDFS